MPIITSDLITSGVAVNLASSEMLYVNTGVTVGSTGSNGVVSANLAELYILGTVFGAADGYFGGGGDCHVTIGVGGAITGLGNGEFAGIEFSGGANSILNNGSIAGFHGVLINGSGNTIVNNGDISGLWGVQVATGTATAISNSGHITASVNQAIDLHGGGNTISNSGIISAVSLAAIAIESVPADGVNVIRNSGTIMSGGFDAIVSGDGTTWINNSGTIGGSIEFGAGNDIYDGERGTVTGGVHGGPGNDTITTGAGRDFLDGGAGADTLDGGVGRDQFYCAFVNESSSSAYDTIVGFDARKDTFLLPVSVTGIDATVASGQLRAGHVASDLQTALTPAALLAHHAVLFTPTTGDLAGHTFLVVDADGRAGFKADKDFVFDLSDADNLGALSTHDFGPAF